MDKVRVLNFVAVRLKSTRLPRKALLLLSGKPVLWHLLDRISRAKTPVKTVICTSTLSGDDDIAHFACGNKIDVFRGHPENVLLRFVEAARKYQADHIVRITGDNPLTDPVLIDEMIKLHLSSGADYTFTEDTPRGTKPEIFSVTALKKALELAEEPDNSEYMTLYIKNYPDLFVQAKYNYPFKDHIRPQYRLTLDTKKDYDVLTQVFNALYDNNPDFSLLDVIDLLDTRPEIVSINKDIPVKDASEVNTRLKVGCANE